MGLAKYLEDNLERLYASLEDSRKQVRSIDESSTDKDWSLIKSRLEKELTLVSSQYDEVLKIVTNPQFDDFTALYEENLLLEEKIKAGLKHNDSLNSALTDSNSKVEAMSKEIFELQQKLKEKNKMLAEAYKLVDKSEQIAEGLRSEMTPVKNQLNHQVQKYNNLRMLNDKLIADLEAKSEKIATLELLLESPEQSVEIMNLKDDEIRQLKQDINTLQDWCELLEAEAGIERVESIGPPSNRISTKNKKQMPKTLSSFIDLMHENTYLKSQMDLVNQIVKDQKECISETEASIERLKWDIASKSKKISNLEGLNLELSSTLKALQASKAGDIREGDRVVNNRIVTKKYEPSKKTLPPARKKSIAVSKGIADSKQVTREPIRHQSSVKPDTEKQYADYLSKYKKR
jgi:chromosome segregation ATPase